MCSTAIPSPQTPEEKEQGVGVDKGITCKTHARSEAKDHEKMA